MQQKTYPPVLSTSVKTPTDSPQISASPQITTKKEGYQNFQRYLNNGNKGVQIIHENRLIDLKFLGSGGSKLVYEINDGYAVALLNLTSNTTGSISLWECMIQVETMFSQQLQKAGLYTQHYAITTVFFDGHETKALKMPSFLSSANKGFQVRDVKNSLDSQYGTSMLFGSLANLQSENHWQKLLEGFQNDLVIYYSEGLAFGRDTFNLVIADTPETPTHDRSVTDLFTTRKQCVHFCFYDFSNQLNTYAKTKYPFLDLNGDVVREAIEAEANYLFSTVTNTIAISCLPIECVNILGGYELLLTSQPSPPEIIPDKTIVLQRRENTIYAYFMNQHKVIEEKKWDLLNLKDLLNLDADLSTAVGVLKYVDLSPERLEVAYIEIRKSSTVLQALKFPTSEAADYKITVSENRKLVEKIIKLCGCHQYDTVNYVFNLLALAKSTLEKVKPWFIKAVTDDLIVKLEQLPIEDRKAKFDICNKYSKGTIKNV